MIGGQDREARELLHALEQVGDLDVGVAVVRVADGASLAEQRVGLVEEKHGAGALGVVEDDVEVLLGLADVFRDDLREVDGKEIGCELGGDGMGGHGLAGAALPGEQRGDALRVDERAEAPIVEHLAAEADMLDQRAQLGFRLLRKDDAVKAREWPVVRAGSGSSLRARRRSRDAAMRLKSASQSLASGRVGRPLSDAADSAIAT